MSAVLDRTLDLLRELVRCDTRNPPRAIDASHAIVGALRSPLAARGFDVEVTDLGRGSVNIFATRGKPSLLFNFHVDTVPDAANWSGSPFELRIAGDRAVGLGACDIKGAAAAMIAAAERCEGPAALLFSTDEEAGNDECVRHFVQDASKSASFRGVVVAEPTKNHATIAHRGTVSCEASFGGVSGHGSDPRALHDSAVHSFLRWGAKALHLAESLEVEEVSGLRGVRFNVGIVNGGTKANTAPSLPRIDPILFGSSFNAEQVPVLINDWILGVGDQPGTDLARAETAAGQLESRGVEFLLRLQGLEEPVA